MALVTVTKKASTYQKYVLTAYTDMAAALNYLQPRGYSGNMSMAADGTWTLWFQSTNQPTAYQGHINDIIILENDTYASIVTPTQYAATFN
jgi:hypothetical protein